jgi:organic radical activating enzyme
LHPPTSVATIVANAQKHAKTIVITGGEPLTWNMNPLTSQLKNAGLHVHIETSGAYDVTGTWDWFCLSPKKNKLPVESAYAIANELKVIIHNKHDFIFAEEQAEKTNKNAILFLQPGWSKKEEMTPLIVEYVMKNPKWRVSLQTHKYLNIP